MDRQTLENKEAQQIDSLTPQEIDCIKEVVVPEYYADLNVDGIRQKLVKQLLKHEKDSIYEISEIDEPLRDLRENLDDLDNEFKELEAIIEGQTNEYLTIINDLSNFEVQGKIVDTRINNYERLRDSLQMLIGETDFAEEDIATLSHPNFDDTSSVEAALAVLKTLGKYIRNSNRFLENQYIVQKNQEFSKYVHTFESKLKEHLKKLSKKAAKYYSEKEHQDESNLVETGFFRKSIIPLKGIFQQLFLIHDCSEQYFQSLIRDIAAQITEFTNLNLPNFEKKWNSVLGSFNIFKNKWNIASQMEINSENLNDNVNKTQKLNTFLNKIISNFDEQMEKDEVFWIRFFSFDDRKLTRGNNDINFFLTSIYTIPKHKLISLLNGMKSQSSISSFFILSELKNILEAKKSEELEREDIQGEGTSFSESTITEVYTALNIQNNSFAQEQKKFLENYRPEIKQSEVLLLPVRNFTALSVALYQIFANTNKDIFLLNVREIYDAIDNWLQKVTQLNTKVKDVLLIENSFYMSTKFGKISDPIYTQISNDTKAIFERHTKLYVKGVFAKAFSAVADVWFKIKEIFEQTDVSTIPLSGQYSKTYFLKNIKMTFSMTAGTIEKIITKISKEFSKEGGLQKVIYERFMEYMLKEYEEIEKFVNKAYNEKINPSKAEIQAVLMDKRN